MKGDRGQVGKQFLLLVAIIEDLGMAKQVNKRTEEGNQDYHNRPRCLFASQHSLPGSQILQQHYCQHPVQDTKEDERQNPLEFQTLACRKMR